MFVEFPSRVPEQHRGHRIGHLPPPPLGSGFFPSHLSLLFLWCQKKPGVGRGRRGNGITYSEEEEDGKWADDDITGAMRRKKGGKDETPFFPEKKTLQKNCCSLCCSAPTGRFFSRVINSTTILLFLIFCSLESSDSTVPPRPLKN